jgi:hypothetical protein
MKNKLKNKNVLKATQIVNIVTARRREKKPLSQGNRTLIRNIHHFNTPVFQPIGNHPQPVGTRPEIDETIATLQRSVKQLQETAFPARATINLQSPLAKEPSMFRSLPNPKDLIKEFTKEKK